MPALSSDPALIRSRARRRPIFPSNSTISLTAPVKKRLRSRAATLIAACSRRLCGSANFLRVRGLGLHAGQAVITGSTRAYWSCQSAASCVLASATSAHCRLFFILIGVLMRLVRFGQPGQERPGIIDPSGAIRDLSGIVDDIDGTTVSPAALQS